MQERNIDWLLLACPQMGTRPATQVCALTGNRTSDLSFQAGAQPTVPHQPEHPHSFACRVFVCQLTCLLDCKHVKNRECLHL